MKHQSNCSDRSRISETGSTPREFVSFAPPLNLPLKCIILPILQGLSVNELTDGQMGNLCSKLKKEELKRLALFLGRSAAEIDTSFTDHPKVSEAANHVLTNWLHGQNNRHEAYNNMGAALVHNDVNLNLTAKEVLNYPPMYGWDLYLLYTYIHMRFVHSLCNW